MAGVLLVSIKPHFTNIHRLALFQPIFRPMSTKTNIFLTGATGKFTTPRHLCPPEADCAPRKHEGYIGGSVLSRFLKHPDASSFNITVLVRSPEKAEKLKAFEVNPVVGSHSDTPLVEK